MHSFIHNNISTASHKNPIDLVSRLFRRGKILIETPSYFNVFDGQVPIFIKFVHIIFMQSDPIYLF